LSPPLDSIPVPRRRRLFFTPERATALIAGMPALCESGTLEVLDPGAGWGAGSGMLTGAHVERVVMEVRAAIAELVGVSRPTVIR